MAKKDEVKKDEVKKDEVKKEETVDTVPEKAETLAPFEEWANKQFLKPWQIAGIREMYKIKPGKQIDKKSFDDMLAGFSKKPIGG